jgi:glucose-6-phosphate isomerase, archaeal
MRIDRDVAKIQTASDTLIPLKGRDMTLIEPGVCRVDVVRGQLVGATSHYVKTLADLDGLYEDAVAFDALKGVMRDEVVYEVTDYKPSARKGRT